MTARVLTLVLLAALVGCRSQEIETVYGVRSGFGAQSINGTSVLGEMFESAGHRVRSWRYLSPSLEEADVVVWFPSELYGGPSGPPSAEAVAWFENWLRYSEQEKTLIYVGRDYEADSLYWSTAPAPPGLKGRYAGRLTRAQADERSRINSAPTGEAGDWFTLEQPQKRRQVEQLAGPWADGVQASEAQIVTWRRVAPAESSDVLLTGGDGAPLVSEHLYDAGNVGWTDNDSRLIVVENASFLLNASLVNKEHRKLAGKLIDRVGDPTKKVVFLEASASPRVSETDPSARPPSGLQLFTVWPIGAALAQLAALGIVYAAAVWPIFGTPRRLRRPSLTDFGDHVAALGRLLAGTRDRPYASSLLKKYFEESHKD